MPLSACPGEGEREGAHGHREALSAGIESVGFGWVFSGSGSLRGPRFTLVLSLPFHCPCASTQGEESGMSFNPVHATWQDGVLESD